MSIIISRVVFIAGLLVIVIGVLLNHGKAKSYLLKSLTVEHVIPSSASEGRTDSASLVAIYVLGGAQPSLEKRFAIASSLYRAGAATKVLFLSLPGITQYSLVLGRNLTNDEWAATKLTDLGIPPTDLEPIIVQLGVFGTLREARGIIEVARSRGYKTLILITSSYHTSRAWEAFTYFAVGKDIALYVYGAPDEVGVAALFLEYLKLQVYKSFLL